MNVHNLFPGIIADPLDKSPIEVISEVDYNKIDMFVMLTVNDVAGQWDVNVVSARMSNAEILLALELMKRNILERMTYAEM
jgi:hypothetical protein